LACGEPRLSSPFQREMNFSACFAVGSVECSRWVRATSAWARGLTASFCRLADSCSECLVFFDSTSVIRW
jgi:hypothetical protein